MPFIHLCAGVPVCPQPTRVSRRTICGHQFSLSTKWIEGQTWVVRLPTEPSCLPSGPLSILFISTDVSNREYKTPLQEPQKQPAPETPEGRRCGETVAAGPCGFKGPSPPWAGQVRGVGAGGTTSKDCSHGFSLFQVSFHYRILIIYNGFIVLFPTFVYFVIIHCTSFSCPLCSCCPFPFPESSSTFTSSSFGVSCLFLCFSPPTNL